MSSIRIVSVAAATWLAGGSVGCRCGSEGAGAELDDDGNGGRSVLGAGHNAGSPAAAQERGPAGGARLLAEGAAPDAATQLAVLAAMTQWTELVDWEPRLAYDLGSLRLVVLAKRGSLQSVAVLQMDPPEGVTVTDLERSFRAEPDAPGVSAPLEMLGYDRVVVRETHDATLGPIPAPEVGISWERVDEHSGERESGDGSVTWVRCLDASRWTFVSGEGALGRYEPEETRDFARRMSWCGARQD